jgi:6-phosphogluconolactonase
MRYLSHRRFRLLRLEAVAIMLAAGLLYPASALAANEVFAVNVGAGTVSPFSVGAGGALTLIGTAVTSGASTGSSPRAAVVSMDGKYLFVPNYSDGTVSTFAIGAGGTLTQIGTGVSSGTGPGSGPTGAAIDPDGQYLFVPDYSDGAVSTFTIGAGGTLTQIGTGVSSGSGAGSGPTAADVSPDGRYLFVVNQKLGTVSTFAIGTGGVLTQQGTGVPTGASSSSTPANLALTPDGQHLYVANENDGTISTFSVGNDGALTVQGQATSSISGSTTEPDDVTVSPNGNDLYVSNFYDGSYLRGPISTFAIGADGTLTAVGNPVPSGEGNDPESEGVSLSPDGNYLYAANFGQGTVSTFTIGADGAPTQQGTPVSNGEPNTSQGPDSVVTAPDQGPAASFAETPAAAGSPAAFSAQASTPGTEPIAVYIWQFGDGTTGTGANVSHTYATPGTYTVTLTETGSDGCSTTGPFVGQSPYCIPDPGATTTRTVTTAALTVPVSTAAPVITGTAKRGDALSCSTGTWTDAPTGFAYQWGRDGTPIVGATMRTYVVRTSDEQLTLACTVTASNAVGSGRPASSTGVFVPVPRVARCPAASGALTGTTLGLVHLGMTRVQARHAYTKSSNRGKSYQDFFCLTPIGVRVGYGSPKLPRKYANRVIWASTSSAYYTVHGIRVGATITAADKVLKLTGPIKVGVNDWYLARNGNSTAVFKVRKGVIQEIGIGEKSLTTGHRAQVKFLESFS